MLIVLAKMQLILNYLSDRWHRTKINVSFSSWSEVLNGVPQWSVLGLVLFNIYLNDLFYGISNTDICNLADTTQHMPVMLIYQLPYIT